MDDAIGNVDQDRVAGFDQRDQAAFRSVIARHPQVGRIACGHHHRPIFGQCAHAIVSISPSVAHQVELTFNPADPGAFNFEPPAIQLHLLNGANTFVTHTIYTDRYRGPFPFLTNSDHSGT